MASTRTLPFWWDDVSDFGALETLVVQTFNKVQQTVNVCCCFYSNLFGMVFVVAEKLSDIV